METKYVLWRYVVEGFNWNEKTVKADVFDRNTHQVVRQTLSPRDIISSPVGKQPEVIIMACAKVLSELIDLKEEEAERIMSIINKTKN